MSCVVNFYNSGIVNYDRKIGPWICKKKVFCKKYKRACVVNWSSPISALKFCNKKLEGAGKKIS
jgi:hypothetical protein